MSGRKKLIEVALPLDAINKASAREKSIRHGHPSTLHLWWARRPLAAARAVIFAQMVDDPSACPDLFPTEKAQEKERQRLFKIIEDLVQWENTTNEAVLEKARAEIWQSWRRACEDFRKREAGSGKREAGSGKRGAGSGEREARSGEREARSGRRKPLPAPRSQPLPAPRFPLLSSTPTSCLPSTIRSPAVGRCRWRHSG